MEFKFRQGKENRNDGQTALIVTIFRKWTVNDRKEKNIPPKSRETDQRGHFIAGNRRERD